MMEFAYEESVETSPIEMLVSDEEDLDEDGYRVVEYTVEFSVYGKYRAQTYWEPAEYPELEITSVTGPDGKEMPREWVSAREKDLEARAWAVAEDYARDYYEPDYDDYDSRGRRRW